MTMVHNTLAHGLELRLYEMIDAEHGAFSINPGVTTARRKGVNVVLRSGRNEVDDEWWREWAEANKDGDLLKSHTIYAEDQPEVRPS